MDTQPNQATDAGTGLRRVCLGAWLIILIGSLGASAAASDILIGTGPHGSFAHFVGRAVARAVHRSGADLACEVIAADSGTDSLTNLNSGSLDLALLDSRLLVDATTRAGRFAFLDIRYDNLGLLLSLYHESTVLVARVDAGIHRVADLQGKRINAGGPSSAASEAFAFIMDAKGWTREDFKLVQALTPTLSQDTMAFCHGSVDAMVHTGVHPDAALQQLIDLCDARLIGLADADITSRVAGRAGLAMVEIPAATYPGIDTPVAALAATIHLVASGDLDPQTTQALLAAIKRHQERLQTIHPALRHFTVTEPDSSVLGIDLHPGAVAYFSMHNQ